MALLDKYSWQDPDDEFFGGGGLSSPTPTLPTTGASTTPTTPTTPAVTNTREPFGTPAPVSAPAAPTGGGEWGGLYEAYQTYLGREPDAGGWEAHLKNPGGPSAAVRAVQSSPEASAYSRVRTYQDQVTALQSEKDPVKQAQQRDALARQVFNDLKAGGHDVKWDGDMLIVDGRAYTIAGAPGTGGTPGATTTGWGLTPGGGRQEFSYTGPGGPYQPGAFRGSMEGFDPAKFDPSHPEANSLKMIFARAAETIDPNDPAAVDKVVALLNSYGIAAQKTGTYGDLIRFPTGEVIDVLRNGAVVRGEPGATAAWAWMTQNTGGVTPGAEASTIGVPGPGAPGAAGVHVPSVGAPGPGGTVPGPASTTAPTPGWSVTTPPYTPGEISMDDLEGLDMESILSRIGPTPTPTLGTEFGPLGSGTDAATQKLIEQILASPTALSDQVLAMMKAASKEELGLAAQENDDDLALAAQALGITDSNWLASERASSRRGRDEAMTRSFRDLEIETAKTRMEDMRAAASLGATFTDQQAARNRADYETRRTTAQMNIENQFKSAAERRQAVALAADTQLRAAAQTGDRMALREQLNIKAAELGLKADDLMLQYTLGLLSDTTKRYGIDVEASLTREKLAQAGREFQEDLAFRIMALEAEVGYRYAALGQSGEQFDAQHGLNLARFFADRDDEAYRRYST